MIWFSDIGWDKEEMGGTGNVLYFHLLALTIPNLSRPQGAFPPPPGNAAANQRYSPDSISPLITPQYHWETFRL